MLYDVKCSVCGKATKVVFQPEKGRPVYCKNCLKKVKNSQGQEKISKTPSVSLKEAFGKEVVPFSVSRRKIEKEKPKRKEVDLAELRKALEESLSPSETGKSKEKKAGKQEENKRTPQGEPSPVVNREERGSTTGDNKIKKGEIKPGETINL